MRTCILLILFGCSIFHAAAQVTKPDSAQRPMQIMLVLPFELEKNFSDTADYTHGLVDPASVPALHFYEGALLAVDSLQKDSIRVSLTTCDTPSDSAGVLRLLAQASIRQADLVIGNFPSNLAHAAAFGAARHGIKLMLTQGTSPSVVTGHQEVALALASTHTQCRKMTDFMMNYFPKSNVILVYRNMKREDELATVFRDELNSLGSFDTLREFNASRTDIAELTLSIDTTKRNVVFVVSSDEAFVSPVLTLLEERKLYGIQVSGLPTWQNFEAVDFMGFSNVQVFNFDNNYIDYETMKCNNFRRKFLSSYATDPMPQAFSGFDIVYQAGKSFKNHQTEFLHHLEQWNGTGCVQFEFVGTEGNGKENQRIAVMRFLNYRLELLNRK